MLGAPIRLAIELALESSFTSSKRTVWADPMSPSIKVSREVLHAFRHPFRDGRKTTPLSAPRLARGKQSSALVEVRDNRFPLCRIEFSSIIPPTYAGSLSTGIPHNSSHFVERPTITIQLLFEVS
jgi:hypothetical protein